MGSLRPQHGFEMPRAIGDASNWGNWAKSHGYPVNMTPARGSVAWWGGANHVAWVRSVNSDGTVTLEEYNNPAGSGKYNVRSVSKSSVGGYIHFKDLPASSIANGDYIQVTGKGTVYRFAGGARLNKSV